MNNSNDINELIKKLDNKLVSSNICLNLPSDDIDLNLDLILDFSSNKVKDEKNIIDIKNNEINLEVNAIRNNNKFKSKKESSNPNDLRNGKKIKKIDNNDIQYDNHVNCNKPLNEYKTNNKNEIIDNKINEKEKEKENRIKENKIREEELRRENEDKEREKEEDERRQKEEKERKKRETERKKIIENAKNNKEEKIKKKEKELENSKNNIKPIEKSQLFDKYKNSKIFLSLSENEKNDILSILHEINILKSGNNNIKDIDKYPTITLNFEKKEKALDDIIFYNK